MEQWRMKQRWCVVWIISLAPACPEPTNNSKSDNLQASFQIKARNLFYYIYFFFLFLWFETRNNHRFVSREWACKSQVSSRRSKEEAQSDIGTWDHPQSVCIHDFDRLPLLDPVWHIFVDALCHLSYSCYQASCSHTCDYYCTRDMHWPPHIARQDFTYVSGPFIKERKQKFRFLMKQGWMRILQNPFYDLHACTSQKASRSTFTGLYMRILDYKRLRSSASFRTIGYAQDSTTTY